MSSVKRRRSGARLTTLLFLAGAMVAALAAPATATDKGGSQGPTIVEGGLGYFYGDFGSPTAYHMLVGGAAEDFCEADPDSPFGAEPGSTTLVIRERKDGTTVIRSRSWDQPVHLYKAADPMAPSWIAGVCEAYFADGTVPTPFASGSAVVRSRVKIMPDGTVDVFNASRGFVYDAEGAKYKIRGAADFLVENGAPVGDPAEFVSFKLRKLRW